MKQTPNSWHLQRGPRKVLYRTASDAIERLRQACLIVFGPDGVSAHESWTGGHARNFQEWEHDGRPDVRLNMMRSALFATAYGPAFDSACRELKMELRRSALDAMERFNKGMLESGGPLFEAVEQKDGTLQFVVKQTSSDEEVIAATADKVGHNLFQDSSNQARELLVFLGRVHETNTGKPIDGPKEAGAAWLACYSEERESETARVFKVLNDAWVATRPSVK